MKRTIIGVICLFATGFSGAYAQSAPPASSGDTGKRTVTPDQRANTSMSHDGVVHPPPDASNDTTVKPPDVDPGMAVKPPGTPGGDMKVIPK
jgi:hypothetical protein